MSAPEAPIVFAECDDCYAIVPLETLDDDNRCRSCAAAHEERQSMRAHERQAQ